MNNLFLKLTQVLRKNTGPYAAVVPFAVGRIYQSVYRNWKHDPRPLLIILSSDAFYTTGINIHYLGAYYSSMIQFIMMMRQSNKVLSGLIIYRVLKMRLPGVPKMAFRKYFTSMLRGKLVSEGLSTLPEPNKALFVADPFVRQLNARIHPPIFSFNKQQVDPQNLEDVRREVDQSQWAADRTRPYANGPTNQSGGIIVQYQNPMQDNNNGTPGTGTPGNGTPGTPGTGA
jgi:hypothetical protein